MLVPSKFSTCSTQRRTFNIKKIAMEHFDNKVKMVENLKKRRLTVTGHDIYSQAPVEYAGTWDYKNGPQPGKENITPVIVDLIRKYQKAIP